MSIEVPKKQKFKEGDFVAKNFQNYLDDLGISEADLEGKKVLDVGAGAGAFATHCLRSGVNCEVYSLEPRIGKIPLENKEELDTILDRRTRKEVDSKTAKAIMENMPFRDQSLDLILVENAMPGFDSANNEEMRTSVENSFNEIIRILKPGGEARLYPLYIDEYEEFRRPWIEEINRKLGELIRNKNLEISIQKVRKLPSSLAPDAVRETYGRIIIKKIGG